MTRYGTGQAPGDEVTAPPWEAHPPAPEPPVPGPGFSTRLTAPLLMGSLPPCRRSVACVSLFSFFFLGSGHCGPPRGRTAARSPAPQVLRFLPHPKVGVSTKEYR